MNRQEMFVRAEWVNRGGYGRLADAGRSAEGLIRRLTTPLRQARIWHPGEVKAEVTDVSLLRVMVTAGAKGSRITIRAKP